MGIVRSNVRNDVLHCQSAIWYRSLSSPLECNFLRCLIATGLLSITALFLGLCILACIRLLGILFRRLFWPRNLRLLDWWLAVLQVPVSGTYDSYTCPAAVKR